MKKGLLALLALPLLLAGCNNAAPAVTIDTGRLSGDISAFNLTGPANDFVATGGFTFTWEAANNAEQYSIEIAETENFYNDKLNSKVYVKENNISQNNYDLNYSLPKKDILYFWRITALNKDHTKLSNQVGTFYYKSVKVSEIPIEIEDAQDWGVHKEGSKAEVSIDRNNFFNNNKNSLVVSFKKEDTSQGNIKSDGWIVITKTADMELYGTNAFFMNFYYSGHDSTILIRVLDNDGEYWHQQVRISNNAKQTVILKYDKFTLRTSGTNIFNREFDWQRIHYFEIVFEKTFGDGVCMLSDIKAINYEDYADMYMTKMDFRRSDIDQWTYENYKFKKVVSEEGDELTLEYSSTATSELEKFPGYGFQNVNIYKFFDEGDALKMKVKYTGSIRDDTMFYFRILEEDNDRWQFKLSYSKLVKDNYVDILLPLNATQRVEYMNGDGAKQFYFIYKINFGLSNNYASGTLSIKDLELVYLDDVLETRKITVASNGCIENFNDYDLYTELYYHWEQSFVNKDEAIKLDDVHKAGGIRNIQCAEFDYKADMEPAQYQAKLDSSAVVDKNALRLWLKDATPKSDKGSLAYLDPEEVAANMTIQLTMSSGEKYRYTIDCVKKEWNAYTIPFSLFTVANPKELPGDPKPLTSNKIDSIGFAFQYFYFDEQGNKDPTYAIANPVYIDEIYLVNIEEVLEEPSIVKLDSTINTDTDDANKVTIDTFERYKNINEVQDYWLFDENKGELSDVVSSEDLGGKNSLKMNYKEITNFVRDSSFAQEVTAKGISFDLKADGKAKINIYLYLRVGTTVYKMSYQADAYQKNPILPTDYESSSDWYHYEIGFNFFKNITDSTSKSITNSTAKNIQLIEFAISNSTNEASSVYLDNLRFLKNVTLTTRTISKIVIS